MLLWVSLRILLASRTSVVFSSIGEHVFAWAIGSKIVEVLDCISEGGETNFL